jgi:5-methylcytosine-specific restriction endonuclease McrA
MSPSRIPDRVRERVRRDAGNRCGYCLSPQRLVLGTLEIEHIEPVGAGGSDAEGNLWVACRLCNNFKGVQTEAVDPETGQRVRLFNPCRDIIPGESGSLRAGRSRRRSIRSDTYQV